MARDRSRRHQRVFGENDVPEGEVHPTAVRKPAIDAPLPAPSGLRLKYKRNAPHDNLQLYECTILPAHEGDKTWWMLWMHVRREDGVPATIAVPIAVGGASAESGGPSGPGDNRIWGLAKTNDQSAWQVTSPVNLLSGVDGKFELAIGRQADRQSLWHQQPCVTGVPGNLDWMEGPPPPPLKATEDESDGLYAGVPMAPADAPAQPTPPAE